MTDDGYTRITLRIPDALHAELTAAAARTSKSMNAEIVARLEGSTELEKERLRGQTAINTLAEALQSTQRTLSLTAFYLRDCAARVPQDSEQTRALMEHIQQFASALYHGQPKGALEPLSKMIDMGVSMGVIDPETRKTRPEHQINHPPAAKAKKQAKK